MAKETTYYYFTADNERLGPYSVQQLQGMLDAGRIPESASVLSSVNGNWHLLVDVLNGDHPYPMSRRHELGKCPRCHAEVETITEASYGKCSRCKFPLGTPRRVSGIRKNFKYTLAKRYCCFRGRAVKTEYWSFMAIVGYAALVAAVALFVFFLLVADDFNMHLLNGRNWADVLFNEEDFPVAFYVVFGILGLVGAGLVIPMCGLTMRRLQDIGYSGLWALLAIVPALLFVGCGVVDLLPVELPALEGLQVLVRHPGYILYTFAALLVVMILLPLKDSQPGPNKYGPSPKYPRL